MADPDQARVIEILKAAFDSSASHFHIDLAADGVRIRARISGRLKDLTRLDPAVGYRLATVLEQGSRGGWGCVELTGGSTALYYRLASCRSAGGHRLVVTPVPPPDQAAADTLDGLGAPEDTTKLLEALLSGERGLILIAGPPMSGRERTQMALAGSLVQAGASVLRLSYGVPERTEVEPLPILGVDSQSELWSILDGVEAMDADGVVLPEIECALHATVSLALSAGRRIGLATIRAQDAAGAVARLVSLGVSRHRLSRDVVAVVAQHRLPTPCSSCGPLCSIAEEDVPVAGWDASSRQELLRSGPKARMRGRGCASCQGSGYEGWTIVFECLPFAGEVQEQIRLVEDHGQLRESLKRFNAGKSLLGAAWREVLRGRAEPKALRSVPGPEVAPFKISRASLRQVPDVSPRVAAEAGHREESGGGRAGGAGVAEAKPGSVGHQLYEDCYGVVKQAMEVLGSGTLLEPGPLKRVARRIVQSIERDQELANIALTSRAGEDLVVHQLNVAILAVRIATGLSLDRPELERLALAALVHDVGLLRVYDGVRDTYSDSRKEQGDHHGHSKEGAEMIQKSLPSLDWLATVVCQVHERVSGRGEPDGLRGDAIHPLAQILGLADMLESLTRPRPGKETFTTYDAIQHLIRDIPGEFDERHIRALARHISLFPVGSFVLLNNRSIARVTTINPDNFHRPKVEILRDPGGRLMKPATSVDLGDSPFLYITGPLRELPPTDGEDLPA